jgi:hypothetical protein
VVIVLTSGPKFFDGSNPAEAGEFLMAIKIRRTTSLGGEVNPMVPYGKILRHVKKACGV